ncbi:MAG: winged helix-turn-helix transcriptional regulator [Planctomycetes bacterium]|nr:winged helix-turn-helix transcriptional regulator [Planctomycetota bacterium]
MQELLNIARALSDPNRVRVLMFLRGRELCLCQIIEVLGLASSTVSRHMSLLCQAGLVSVRRNGRWRHFRLPGAGAPPRARRCLRWLEETLAEDAAVARDGRRLKAVLKVPVEVLCGNGRKER